LFSAVATWFGVSTRIRAPARIAVDFERFRLDLGLVWLSRWATYSVVGVNSQVSTVTEISGGVGGLARVPQEGLAPILRLILSLN